MKLGPRDVPGGSVEGSHEIPRSGGTPPTSRRRDVVMGALRPVSCRGWRTSQQAAPQAVAQRHRRIRPLRGANRDRIAPLIVLYKMGGVYAHIVHVFESAHGFSGNLILGSRARNLRFPRLPGPRSQISGAPGPRIADFQGCRAQNELPGEMVVSRNSGP